MRRRRALIDDYLRAHDPAPPVPAAKDPRSFAVGGADAGRPLQRRRPARRAGLLALAVSTTLAAIAIIAFMPGRASRSTEPFLSPEAAVAAASQNLEEDGILHWKFRTSVRPGTRGAAVVPDVYGFEEWRDLKTHASYRIMPRGAAGQLAAMAFRTWYNGKRTTRALYGVPAGATDPRPVVVRTVRRRGEPIPNGTARTPIDSVRRLLRSAEQGEAQVTRAPNEHDVPVVRIDRTKVVQAGTNVLSTWITREKTPRLLRSTSHFTPSPYGRSRGAEASEVIREFTIWQLLPRTPENIRRVQPPEFDPAKYRVTTQFLGPRKR